MRECKSITTTICLKIRAFPKQARGIGQVPHEYTHSLTKAKYPL